MRKTTKLALSAILCTTLANASGYGVPKFEAPKDTSGFDKVEVNYNFDLTFNYQGLSQDYNPTDTDAVTGELLGGTPIQSGLSLPTANFDINAKIMKGFNVKLETMLSSHHHHETFVKGGYASIDSLDFIAPGFLSGLMEQTTLKIGVNDINFGDNQFRRSDNADVMNNPFVTNLAVLSYMQAAFVEGLYRIPSADMLVNLGVTSGQANPSDTTDAGEDSGEYSIYGKLAYDKQFNDSLRLRIAQSLFTGSHSRNSLYHGDKAGNVATDVFEVSGDTQDFGTEWDWVGTGSGSMTAALTNVFAKYNGTEFYGLFELTDVSYSGTGAEEDKTLTHYAVDLVQRFGTDDKFYVAGRYEGASVEQGSAKDQELTQMQLSLGWFLSPNAMAKIEYVKQDRDNFDAAYVNGSASYDGFMISTALSF